MSGAVKPATLRLVVTHTHELGRSERAGLAQVRAVLEQPGTLAVRVNSDPAAEKEQRFIEEYLEHLEQPDRPIPALPPAWLEYETVIAVPIHAPIHFAAQSLAAGYRDLMIFNPPTAEAAYASHYSDDRLFGPRLVAEVGTWMKRHVQLHQEEVSQ